MSDGRKINRTFRKAMADSALKRRIALSGGLLSVLSAAVFLLFSTLIILRGIFPGWEYLPFFSFLFFWGGVICAAAFSVSSPLFRPADRKELAGILDSKMGNFKNLFGSALEFSSDKYRNKSYSRYLMEETVRRANKDINKLTEKNVFSLEGRPEWAVAGILLGALLILQILFTQGSVIDILSFISDPGISFRNTKEANILVRSGNISILEGEDVYVEGVNFGYGTDEVFLRTSLVNGIWREEKIEPDTVLTGGVPMSLYYKHLESPGNSFLYCFRSGKNSSDTFKVDVAYRPVINRMSAKLGYPDYTAMPPETVEALAGRLSVPLGTEIDISGETSKDIKNGTLFFTSGGVVPVEVTVDGFRVSFTAQNDDTFRVGVIDWEGHKNRQRIAYPVQVINDLLPDVKILAPENEAQLPRSLLIDLQYRAVDDYSVADINLMFKRDKKDKKYRKIDLPGTGGKHNRVIEEVFEWSLEGNTIMPGDRIFYYLEAYDNNIRSGPGYSRTETRSLEVPSLSQMYANHRKSEARQNKQIDDLYKAGLETKEKLRKLSNKFKAEPKMDWSKKSEGKKLLNKYENLRQKAVEATSRMEKTLDDLQQNRMTSMKIGKKLEMIQKLINRLESERLRKIIEETSRMVDELSEEEIASAMKELEISTDEMTAELDRTIDFLKQVMREEKVEELMRRMESMLERQRALRDSTGTGNLGKLSEEQEKLGAESNKFKADLDSLSRDEGIENDGGMEDFQKRMAGANLDSLMERAAGQMKKGERNRALRTQKETIGEMLGLYTSLGRFQMGMNMTMKEQIKKGIQAAAGRIIETSKLQEEVAEGLSGKGVSGGSSIEEKELVVKGAIRRVTEELYAIARKSMFKSQLVFTHLGGAAQGAEEVLSAMEKGRRGQAKDAATYALSQLNRGVIELLKAGMSKGGGSGSGKKMRTMLNQQMSIDNQLQTMYGNQSKSGLSMRQRAEMSRLAAKQRKMEDVMKQIEEESGEGEDFLGRIEGLASQMDSIAGKLDEGKLDKDLMEMEEKVLGRMLQAQRSINQRDYKRERVSRSSEILWGEDPGTVIGTKGSSDIILEMIRRGMKMKAPREYENLIELYFRALSRQVRKNAE